MAREGNPAQPCRPAAKRGVFWTCLAAGFLAILLSLAASLAWNATRADLFTAGLNATVVAQGRVSQSDADGFVQTTLAYLTGAAQAWEPTVTLGDHSLAVPEAFQTHMATVRGWVLSAGMLLSVGAALMTLLLLAGLWLPARGARHGWFSAAGFYGGAGLALALLVAVGVWGVADFNGLWAWIHATLIPDGVFPAGEEIMILFPVRLFAGYLLPVALGLGLGTALVLLVPPLIKRGQTRRTRTAS
ncbi:MAG: DUF1461 domain-containing protein [Candidatus Limiplasma sp.]|nr:DUF1461 domain-containing protein [Candidatus Limiplasma sp.]